MHATLRRPASRGRLLERLQEAEMLQSIHNGLANNPTRTRAQQLDSTAYAAYWRHQIAELKRQLQQLEQRQHEVKP